MKNAGKARSYGLYRHLRTSKEIIENLLNYYNKYTDKIKFEFTYDNCTEYIPLSPTEQRR